MIKLILMALAVITAVLASAEMFYFLDSMPIVGKSVKDVLSPFGDNPALWSKNQGLYNDFVAVGLLWAAFCTDRRQRFSLASFFLGCIVVAGVYGAVTVKCLLFFLQSVPAAVAWIAIFIAHKSEHRAAG